MPIRHVLVVLGTRPEALKLIPVIKELRARPAAFRTTVCSTGQHREMLKPILSFFDVAIDYDLDIMSPGQTLYEITARTLTGSQGVLAEARPDLLMVQGDTSAAFTAALAAFYAKVPVAHVEAGLRTHNKWSPWPEEMNRQLIGRLADLHFPPTETSREHLLSEGVRAEAISVTGNTVVDALLMAVGILKDKPVSPPAEYDPSRRMVLVTAHRRESFGDAFREMCLAMREIVEARPDVQLLYPVHLNPNVRQPVQEILRGVERLHLLEPMDYPGFVDLMQRSTLILTDSGGVQEEAPALGKPVLVMRENTERPEGVAAGTARLVGTRREVIVREVLRLLDDQAAYEQMAHAVNPYGDGTASRQIAEFLEQHLASG